MNIEELRESLSHLSSLLLSIWLFLVVGTIMIQLLLPKKLRNPKSLSIIGLSSLLLGVGILIWLDRINATYVYKVSHDGLGGALGEAAYFAFLFFHFLFVSAITIITVSKLKKPTPPNQAGADSTAQKTNPR